MAEIINNGIRHVVLQSHSTRCFRHESNKDSPYYGGGTTLNLLMYHDSQFIFLNCCSCHKEFLNYGEFGEKLVNILMEKSKISKSYYMVDRGWLDSECLREIRQGNLLGIFRDEVNYLYTNASYQQFAVTTKIRLIDDIQANRQEYENNYLIAKEYLLSNNYDFMVESLDKLYKINKPVIICKEDMFKTVKALQSGLKQQIKNKKKSLKN